MLLIAPGSLELLGKIIEGIETFSTVKNAMANLALKLDDKMK